MLWKFPPPLSVGPYVSHGEKGGLSIEAGIGSETKKKSYFNSRLSFHWIDSIWLLGKFGATNETGDFRTLFANASRYTDTEHFREEENERATYVEDKR